MPNVFHGRSARLCGQLESTFRTAPASPAGLVVPFTTLDFGREPNRVDDGTMNGEPLANRRDETDSQTSGSLNSILDLHSIGFWLALLWGRPTTTSSSDGKYKHVFTCTLAERPSALLALSYNRERFHRFLGTVVNQMSWNIVEAEQNLTVNLMGGAEVLPRPTASWNDSAPIYQKARACAKGGQVFDTDGSSTLGDISAASVQITNDFEGQMLADGNEGPGYFLLGQPAITGTLSGLFKGSGLTDIARANETRPLSLISRNADRSAVMTLRLPYAEFDEPKQSIQSPRGIVHEIGYRAYGIAGGDRPTITLENSVASYGS